MRSVAAAFGASARWASGDGEWLRPPHALDVLYIAASPKHCRIDSRMRRYLRIAFDRAQKTK